MIRPIKEHPGVFLAGAVTYAVLVHFVLPKYAPNMRSKLPS